MNSIRNTEKSNPDSINLDKMSTFDIIKLINDNDKTVANKVEEQLDVINKVIDMVTLVLKKGGRLFYVGAGTSGRLGVVDAAECPPTFGVSPELVQAIVAGGRSAVFTAREGCEDLINMGSRDIIRRGFCNRDILIGLSTSGRTPYVYGALKKAQQIGARTAVIICNPDGPLTEVADISIKINTGPEVLTGSTRMKAGTAQKMVLNMISTTVMIKLGKTKGNLMINMQVSCSKLTQRAIEVIKEITGVDEKIAKSTLAESGNKISEAIEKIKKYK